MLNSNKQFRLDDSFSLHISHIRDPGRGAGNQRIRKASMALDKLSDSKKSVIKIKNDDELCCVRAIVTIKAYCDLGSRHPKYDSLQRGRPIQRSQARALHRDAGVPKEPCGLPELATFQRHLTDHQIVVLSMDHNYQIIFKGPTQDKHIVHIKVGEHYHGCNSLPGFLGTNHFCLHCQTSYKDDDINHHPCKGKKCHACHQTGCPDFSPSQSPRHRCSRCHHSFFGEQCLGNHYVYSTTNGKKADSNKKIKNVCTSECKCLNCNRLLRPREIETRHMCGAAECPSCRVPQSLPSSMLHPKPAQTGTEKKATEVQKAQGRWFAKQPNQTKPLCVLGQRDNARHGHPRAQPGVCRHVQLRRPLSF